MIPIHELLNRIRWDKDYGKGNFEIGYYDHVEQKLIRIPIREVRFEQGNRFSFDLHTLEGEVISIPFHRIREVYRDNELIWIRPQQPKEGT